MKNTTGKHKNILAGIGLLALLSGGPLLAQTPVTDAVSVEPRQLTGQLGQHGQKLEQLPQDSASSANIDVGSKSSEAAITQIASAPIVGRSTAPLSPPPKIKSGANLTNLVLGLGLIIGLIFALSWLVRRMGQGGLLTSNQMKIVAAMPLGTRERIVVIEVGGQQLLLGITATQINTLHVFSEPVIDSHQAAGQSEFGKKLMAVLQQKSALKPHSKPATESR